jgi:hypothetical protein
MQANSDFNSLKGFLYSYPIFVTAFMWKLMDYSDENVKTIMPFVLIITIEQLWAMNYKLSE